MNHEIVGMGQSSHASHIEAGAGLPVRRTHADVGAGNILPQCRAAAFRVPLRQHHDKHERNVEIAGMGQLWLASILEAIDLLPDRRPFAGGGRIRDATMKYRQGTNASASNLTDKRKNIEIAGKGQRCVASILEANQIIPDRRTFAIGTAVPALPLRERP